MEGGTNLSEIIVDLKSVSKIYDETVALDGINLYIRKNEFVTLLGPSGCGKTTTLRLIGGFEQPSGGKILFEGKDISNLPPYKRRVNTVFQRYALFSHLDVFENIAFGLRIKKLSEKAIKDKVSKMLEQMNLEGFEKRDVNSLSGGQQQRVAIARALVKEPRVLLLDEPLSNLDARLRLQTREEIRRIQKETGVTTIFVTHDQEEAMSISDEIIVMNEGLKQQIGHPQDVYDEPINQFVARFLGNPPINIVPGKLNSGKALLDNGVVIATGIKEPDQEINVGLRPEYLVLSDKGKIIADVEIVEHIGRDTMLLCYIKGIDMKIRAIIPSEKRFKPGEQVKFDCKKVFVFNKETGERYK